jgi:signal transduction histidine kinase
MRRLASRLVASVRVRVTATAMLAVVAALVVSAVVINVTLIRDRQQILMQTAGQDAREVVALNPLLTAPVDLPADSTIDSGLLQVMRDGRLIGASRGLRHVPALWDPGDPLVSPGPGPGPVVGNAKDVQIVSVPVETGGAKGNVVVLLSMEQFDHTVADVRELLELGIPILLVVVGIICWLIVGRALRPIERMRREVAGVATGGGGLETLRVAEPGHDDEVGRLARTLNSMLDRMEASTQRERRFVSDASHELRTPIANIRTELEVALRHPRVTDWSQVASEVLDQNERMERLVAGLLLLARSDEGSLIEAPEPTDLAVLAEAVVAEAPSGTGRPGSPVVVVSAQPAPIRVPAVYAERMLTNLVDNARRFASSRVEVTVETVRSGDGEKAVLTVSDDGPGVAPEDRQRIFERFVRLDEARDRGEGGFGLGLAIVADLSRFYGGSIRIEGDGQGAVFVLELPAADPRLRPSEPRPPRPDPVPSY